jgi:hypothetical protein
MDPERERPPRAKGRPNQEVTNNLENNDTTTDPRLDAAAVEWELAAIAAWSPRGGSELPRLTDDERDQVHDRIDELVAERLRRGDAHRDRLRRTGYHLGAEVAAYRVTMDDANRRVGHMAVMPDPESVVPLLLVPYREAVDIAGEAFAAGFGKVQ